MLQFLWVKEIISWAQNFDKQQQKILKKILFQGLRELFFMP